MGIGISDALKSVSFVVMVAVTFLSGNNPNMLGFGLLIFGSLSFRRFGMFMLVDAAKAGMDAVVVLDNVSIDGEVVVETVIFLDVCLALKAAVAVCA